MAFGSTMGLDTDKVIDVVGSGAAANWFLDHRGKSMLAGKFDPGFKVALHHKDLMICRDMAEKNGNAMLPAVEMTLENYESLMDRGHDEEDISALFRVKKGMFKK